MLEQLRRVRRRYDEVNLSLQDPVILADGGRYAALMKEYKRLQMQLQLAAVAGASTQEADAQRFQQIGALLFAGENTQRFLLLEMRVQQMMADVYKLLSDAAGLDMPGV